MLIRLISIYVLIATGTAYAQDPVVIKVGEQKPDTLTSDAIFQKAYHSRVFLTGGSDMGYASYVHEIDTVNISRRFAEVGIAIFKNDNLGASHILKFGFAPFSNSISRHEYRLSTVFKLCSNSLLRRKGKLPGSRSTRGGVNIELGVRKVQFQEEIKSQPKTFGFIGLNGNSFIGDVGFKLLEDVFFSYSLNYNFRKKPLADFQVKNGVSFNIAVGYSFIFRK